jgi:hypothetical protein
MKASTSIIVLLLMLCSCTKHPTATLAEHVQSKGSVASANVEAGKFLRDLHERGSLPGLSKDEHGELKAKVSDFSQKVVYPVSLTFQLKKDDGRSTYYVVERPSEGSEWKLMKAWEADTVGKTLKEFPTH